MELYSMLSQLRAWERKTAHVEKLLRENMPRVKRDESVPDLSDQERRQLERDLQPVYDDR